ncbi:MAG: polyhydroxyalkanoate depolymerase [Pseudomonadota bacterium]|nr:polyhydroxyalkanoate depolymerase [Pseudomonadota bacterium]
MPLKGTAVTLYQLFEMNHALISPARAAADAWRIALKNPLNPAGYTAWGRGLSAAFELFERATRRYGKPEFGITSAPVGGQRVPVRQEVVWSKPFCRLLHFRKDWPQGHKGDDNKLLIVAPLSGHYATLLRGTVEAMLPRHDVYITDWADARSVPLSMGSFGLDDYVDYLMDIFAFFGGNIGVMAVCQPSVPVLMAVSLMEADKSPNVPHSMVLMGGPIDTRVNPTAVNKLAAERGTDWFAANVIMRVPWPHAGVMRPVYPGFLQLTGFMTMNLDRHLDAHKSLFVHLVQGDGDSAEKHRDFYDEYMAVMDLDANFYLETVESVFVRHALPRGEMSHRGRLVDPSSIRRVALMTVEGEKDDISGVGQTEAAHKLCSSLPDSKRVHYLQKGVGHYGVFNGSRFVSEIAPRISDFISRHRQGPLKQVLRRVQGAARP